MKISEINIGDIFIANIGAVQGSKSAIGGGSRPVKVIKKYKHHVLCETIIMTNLYGFPTIPYRISYMPFELNKRISNQKELKKWIQNNSMSKIFYGKDDYDGPVS